MLQVIEKLSIYNQIRKVPVRNTKGYALSELGLWPSM